MKKLLVLFAVLAFGLTPFIIRAQDIAPESAKPKPLRVISDLDTPPFAYMDGLKKVGFEVELAEAIAAELGTKVEWRKMSFNLSSIGSTLNTGGADMAMCAMTITPEREKSFIFSIPYFRSSLAAAVRNDVDWNHQDWVNGLGPKISSGVQRRTTAETWVRKNLKTNRKTYNTPARVVRALNSRDVQVAVMDEEILSKELVGRKGKFKLVEKGFDLQDYGIAFASSNTELRDKVDEALQRLDIQGVYDQIYQKWFGHLADLPKKIRPTRGDIKAGEFK